MSFNRSGYRPIFPLPPAKSILKDSFGNSAGLRVDTDVYRVVYFGFRLVSDFEVRNILLGRAIDWLLGEHLSFEHDISLESILSPERETDRRALRPTIRIRNLGSSTEKNFSVTCRIETSGVEIYKDTQTVGSLVSQDTLSLSFRSWTPDDFGTYSLTFYVDLPSDENTSNNTKMVFTKVNAFLNVTSKAGVDNRLPGVGVAFGDYDGDGDLDIYVTNWGRSNVLYSNQGDGFFRDVTSESGVGHSGKGRGVVFGDYDNDGDLDIYVVNEGANVLYRNNGSGVFEDVASSSGVGDEGQGRGVAFGDYDNDGYLDIYVVNAGGRNVLYHNNGDGSFSDVTEDVGVGDDGDGRGVVFGDCDNDGDLDIYVVNRGGNVLYRNKGDGSFLDATEETGVGDDGDGNGVAFGDYDNDGDLDIYITNFGSNVLYRNNGDGTFTDVTGEAGVGDEGMGIGVAFGDYDNDGDLDIYLSNRQGSNVLYSNNGDGTFTGITSQAGVGDEEIGYGVAFGDYDQDGDLDIYKANMKADVLYQNNSNSNHWLGVKLIGSVSNRDGIGARVRVMSEDLSQIREISGGSGYCSQSSLSAEFGLGMRTKVDSVIVMWPSRTVDVLSSVSVNSSLTVVEGSFDAIQTDVEEDYQSTVPETFSLSQSYPNPFNPFTTISYQIPESVQVRLMIHNILGQEIRRLVDKYQTAGYYSVVWDGRDDSGKLVTSGVYFYRLEAVGEFVRTKRMVLIR